MQEVRSRPWVDIVRFYRELEEKHGLRLDGMLQLVQSIAASRYAAGLHAATSMHSLMVSQSPVFEHLREMLLVEPKDDRLVFTYFEHPYALPRWTTSCAPEDGFSTLEHFVLDLKKWWVEYPPGRPFTE